MKQSAAVGIVLLTIIIASSCGDAMGADDSTNETATAPAIAGSFPVRRAGARSYRNPIPAFELSIPDGCKDWKITHNSSKEKERPILISKTNSGNLPFISMYINFYDAMDPATKHLIVDTDKLFESKVAEDKRFEKEVLADVEFLSEKKTKAAGLPAFDRTYRSEKSGATYHAIYVLFPDGVVQFTLSAWTPWFEKDDNDFTAIMNALTPL